MKTRNVAILIFNDAEVLDFSGPFEVFNAANEITPHPPIVPAESPFPALADRGDSAETKVKKYFNVFTVSENGEMITARNGYKIVPDFSIKNCPAIDILVIPGGEGRKIQMNNSVVTGWVKKVFGKLELLLTVCTGVFIAGKAGVLDIKKATTHHGSYNEFEKTFPDTELVKNMKFVDNGKIITSGGISAGINASLYVIDRLFGNNLGKKTAKHMEYEY